MLEAPPRRALVTGLALTAVAASLRVAFVVAVSDHETVRTLMLDSQSYHVKALRIAAGSWLGDAVFYQDPLYPYLLAGLYALFGPGSVGVLVAQALLDACTVGLVYALALRIFDPRHAVLAGVLATFYPLFFYYDALLLKVALSVFLITTALVLLVAAADRDRPGANIATAAASRSGTGLWLAGGFALGLAALTRGNYLLFVPVLLAWLALASDPRRSRLRRVALVAGGVCLAILPVTARNYAVGGDLVLVTSQAGQNFYIGNFRGNDTGRYRPPEFLTANPFYEERGFREEAMRRTGGARLAPSELSAYWMRETFREIAADPAHFLRHTARKLVLLASDYEVPASQNFYFFVDQAAPVLGLLPGWGVMLPVALVGMFAARRNGLARIPLLFFWTYAASVIVTFNMSRYRMPLVPVALIFAAAGAWWVVSLVRERRARALAGVAALLLLGWVSLHREVAHDSFAASHYNLGARHFSEARLERARADRLALEGEAAEAAAARRAAGEELRLSEAQYRQGLAIDPNHPELHIALATLLCAEARDLEAAGQLEQALALAREATETAPRSADVWVALARIETGRGHYAEARRALRRALAIDPDHREARAELALLEQIEGDELEGGSGVEASTR